MLTLSTRLADLPDAGLGPFYRHLTAAIGGPDQPTAVGLVGRTVVRWRRLATDGLADGAMRPLIERFAADAAESRRALIETFGARPADRPEAPPLQLQVSDA